MTRQKYRVRTDDSYRILLTETTPYETLLIFSNYDFYSKVRAYRTGSKSALKIPESIALLSGLKKTQKRHSTIPFDYKISKDVDSVRVLQLVHPLNQASFCEFYTKNAPYIVYLCSKSEFSLRKPSKIASSVYQQRNGEVYKSLYLKSGAVDSGLSELHGEDKNNEFASSFFTYSQFNLMYKFFRSSAFLKVEKKFRQMVSIDVSRCFDTIYTHSISWAVKSKKFIKDNIRGEQHSFGNEFDELIRSCNNNETNGIVVGPEFSRIFAEIIFQDIDVAVEKDMNTFGYTHNKDYAIRRYLDDVFIFTNRKEIEEKALEVYSSHLWKYKFRLNAKKTDYMARPFTTNRSRNIESIKSAISSFLNKKIKPYPGQDEKEVALPVFIKYPFTESNKFISSIKANWDGESSFSNYVLSSLHKRLNQVIKNLSKTSIDINPLTIVNFIIFLLDVAFYCFSLMPRVTESYKISQLILLSHRFVRQNYPEYQEKLSAKISESINTLVKNELSDSNVCGLEKYNIILVLEEVDRDLLPSCKDLIEIIFNEAHQADYFSVISALYVAKADSKFAELRKVALERAHSILQVNESFDLDAESLYTLFDLSSCPYISKNDKSKLLDTAMAKFQAEPLGMPELRKSLDFAVFRSELSETLPKYNWFVNWKNIDLLRSLQRKLLKEAY